MNKLDNHIYLIICEITYEQFRKTKFQNYVNYSNLIKTALITQDIGESQITQISNLVKILKYILGFDVFTTSEYVATFYREDKFNEFESIVVKQFESRLNFNWLDILT